MTERSELFLDDSYLTHVKSPIKQITENGVIFEKTIFYPRGGGQPDDKGFLRTPNEKLKVKGIKKVTGGIELMIDGNLDPTTTVEQVIDWEYRYQLMKHHTALHILSTVVWEQYHAKVTGGTIYHNKARLDFDLDEFSQEMAEELVKETNRIIQEDHEVTISFVDRKEAEADPNLIRTKINLLPSSVKEVRLVKIGNVDVQADGGLHVKNTSEIGELVLKSRENKGKGRKRLTVALAD